MSSSAHASSTSSDGEASPSWYDTRFAEIFESVMGNLYDQSMASQKHGEPRLPNIVWKIGGGTIKGLTRPEAIDLLDRKEPPTLKELKELAWLDTHDYGVSGRVLSTVAEGMKQYCLRRIRHEVKGRSEDEKSSARASRCTQT